MKRTTKPAIVHEVGSRPREFQTLAAALQFVHEEKLTGYIVDPEDSVIKVRRGKRQNAAGRWTVPCGSDLETLARGIMRPGGEKVPRQSKEERLREHDRTHATIAALAQSAGRKGLSAPIQTSIGKLAGMPSSIWNYGIYATSQADEPLEVTVWWQTTSTGPVTCKVIKPTAVVVEDSDLFSAKGKLVKPSLKKNQAKGESK